MQQKKGRFSSEWIQQLKQNISLVDIVSENVELRKTGSRFMGRCPFHGDRSPSFSVNKDFYYCFGCKETGDAISFMTKLHGLSFEEACEDLAERANLKIPESAYQLSSEEEKALYERRQKIQKANRLTHFASLQYYHQNLLHSHQSPLFQEARDYLKKRGITQATIDNFQIGVAGSQHDGLVEFFANAKAPLEIAREFGLIRASQKQAGDYDFFRERLVFPLIDVRGRVCGFGGRILPSVEKRPTEMKLPKYLNSSESDLFHKSQFLYALFQARRAIRETETVIIVEGYFDVIALHQAGLENVVATCGTSLTEDHLKILTRLAKRIIVFFDQDFAGISATTKSMELGLRNGLMLYGIPFEGKLDPDEFLLENPEENLKKLQGWIDNAYPLLDHLIETEMRASESNIEQRAQTVKQVTSWLEAYTDPVGRSLRVDQLIQKYRLPKEALGALGQNFRPAPSPQSAARPNQGGYSQARSPQASYQPQQARRKPISPNDRQLLQFLVKFNDYGRYFVDARKQMTEKDTLSALFDDPEVQAWVQKVSDDPAGFSMLKEAPENVVNDLISQELRSVIMEGLLQETVAGDEPQLESLLKRGIYKSWVRFSHGLRAELAITDPAQDIEKFKELSQHYLDLQRKLKDFEDSYVAGKNNE
jgi:DNA primase